MGGGGSSEEEGEAAPRRAGSASGGLCSGALYVARSEFTCLCVARREAFRATDSATFSFGVLMWECATMLPDLRLDINYYKFWRGSQIQAQNLFRRESL